jgi:hypothetical protein
MSQPWVILTLTAEISMTLSRTMGTEKGRWYFTREMLNILKERN